MRSNLRRCLHAITLLAVPVLVAMSACSLGPAEIGEATGESNDELVKPLKPAWEAGRPICPQDLPQFCNIGQAIYDDAGITGDRFICGDFEQGLCECMNQVRKDQKLGTDLKNYWVHTACVDDRGNRSREHATMIAKFPSTCAGPGGCAAGGDAGVPAGHVKLCLLEPQWSQPGTDPAYCCWTQASGSAIEIPESCAAKLCCPPLKTKVVSIGDNGDTPESCKNFYATDFNDDPGTVCNLNDAGVPCTCNRQGAKCCGSTTTDGGTTDGGTTDGGSRDSGTTDGGSKDSGTTDSGTKDSGATDGGSGGTDAGARPCSAERSKWFCRARKECVWEGGECKSLPTPTAP